MDNLKEECPRNLQDHAWRYFEFHATQRIILFRFYIAILVFYSTAIGYLFVRFYEPGDLSEIAVIVSSSTLIILTIIFQLLDRRNVQLTKYAENALIDIEESFNRGPKTIKIFILEHQDVKNKKSKIGHGCCFTIIYCIAYIAAVIAIISAVISIFYFSK